MSDGFVLDASALLCLLNNETGAARVSAVLSQSIINAVNLSEVASKLSDFGLRSEQISALLGSLHLQVAAFGESQALAAAAIRQQTKLAGLSLGDRACLALALAEGRLALTADTAWKRLDPSLSSRIEFLR